MHMADALVSPAVGGAMLAVSAGAVTWSAAKLKKDQDDRRVPLMGVLGAFIFAAQMINFSIPGAGSSGHLGGGILLAVLLGPHAALLALTSALMVQALFFADGGLLALGCNIFNLAVIPVAIVYPLLYKPLIGKNPGTGRQSALLVFSSVVALQLGSLGVVLETVFSGLAALPFRSFVLLMQPIHLAIGLVEGMITAAIVAGVAKARPELLPSARLSHGTTFRPLRAVLLVVISAAVIIGGVAVHVASTSPDGLAWSIANVTGSTGLQGPDSGIHRLFADLQHKTSYMPEYSFGKKPPLAPQQDGQFVAEPRDTAGLAGVTGVFITLSSLWLGGFLLKRRKFFSMKNYQ